VKLEEVARFEELSRMNTTGSNRRDSGAASRSGAAADLAHAQALDEAATERKRAAKQELKRARLRLKEAKREVRRARKAAAAAHETLKEARKKAPAAAVKAAGHLRHGTPAKMARRPIQHRRVKIDATAAPAQRPAPARRAAPAKPRRASTPRRRPAATATPATSRHTSGRRTRVHKTALSPRRQPVKRTRTPSPSPATVKPVEPRVLHLTPISSTGSRTRH